jgi:hypothetical protein
MTFRDCEARMASGISVTCDIYISVMYIPIHIHVHILCVCVCVIERERERERVNTNFVDINLYVCWRVTGGSSVGIVGIRQHTSAYVSIRRASS